MKLLVASVFTNTGLAKTTKNPYSMTRALVLMPFTDIENSNFQSRGQGLTAVELAVNESFSTALLNQFGAAFKGLPIQMDLALTLDRDGRNVIIGFVDPKTS